jgi:hypothetical protein
VGSGFCWPVPGGGGDLSSSWSYQAGVGRVVADGKDEGGAHAVRMDDEWVAWEGSP